MGLNANVLNNSLEFLRRVELKGLEAFAFVEAYTALQNEHAMVSNPALRSIEEAAQGMKMAQAAPAAPDLVKVRKPRT